jgi:hypothetical protein
VADGDGATKIAPYRIPRISSPVQLAKLLGQWVLERARVVIFHSNMGAKNIAAVRVLIGLIHGV